MSFLKPKASTQAPARTKDDCKAAIVQVIDSGKLTLEQLNKIVDLMQNDSKLQRALMFL